MIFDYAGSNGENIFSSHTPLSALSLYRLHVHTESRFRGFSPQQMRFKRNYKKYDMVFDYAGSNGENVFFLSPVPLALPPPHTHKITIWRIFASGNAFLTNP